MRKRITSLLLTLVMLLSLVPAMGVTASAADDFVKVSTYEQLKTAVDIGDAKVKLVADIDTTNDNGGAGVTKQTALTFIGDKNILDLNGYTLKLVSDTGVIFFEILKGLTIMDSRGGGRIDFEYGSSVIYRTTAIHVAPSAGAKLTVESGTLSSTENGITLIKCEGNLTIKGGKIETPITNSGVTPQTIYTFNSYDDGCKILISGGEIYGTTVFTRDDSSVEKFPQDGDYPIQITGGTMKGRVIPVWIKGGEPTNQTEYSPVIEITGGVIHNWGRTGFMANCKRLPTKVVEGSFKDGAIISVGDVKKTSEICVAALGQSAIRYNDEYGPSSQVCRGNGIPGGTVNSGGIAIYTNEDNPVTVIPNAWGIKSVKLDGKEISYAKDWNGEPMEIDNSKDHILTYEWYPLLKGLQDCGYKYDAMFQRYYDGDGGGHGEIITSGTQYSYTIKKGIEPKLYTFNLALDMLHNGKPFLNGHNNHAVKLMVKEAPPTPTIEGSVYYTSSIVYDSRISTAASVNPAEATPAYQWQRSTNGGSTWTNIEGATSGSYTPVAADMGENVRIRVVVTAEGYLGEIVGAALKVRKADNNNTPAPPAVAAQKDDSDAYKKFVISDFNSDKQEYVYTDSPVSGNEWPTPPSGTPITSDTVEHLTEGKTYYIYTRYKATDTHTAGSKISSSSVLLDDETKLNRIILTDESGKVYGSYGSGNTIYIQKDTSVTLTATTNPSGANKWSAFTFKSQYDFAAPFTVTPTESVASGAEIPKVTIHGDKAGTGTLAAEYGGYPAAQSYGTWSVHVYENVSDIGTDAEITVSPSFPDMTMYQGETLPLPEYTVSVYPEGALKNYNLEWRIIQVGSGSPSYKMSDDNITLENGEIVATKKHTGSENTRIALVAINKDNNYYISSLSDFYVTVTEAPTIALTSLTVAPKKVNLANVDDTYQLSAVREPVNAEGSLNWESSNTGVATVDSTGKVTAKAQGTATITVSCGDKKDTCTVLVDHTHNTDAQDWVYMDPGTHIKTCTAGDDFKTKPHNFSDWEDKGDGTHSRHCTVCKMADSSTYTETANHDWQWVVETEATPNAAGKKHEECVDCHARRSENTPIPMLTSIMVEHLTVAKPVKDAAAAAANTTDSTYYVANTEWMAADGTPLAIGGKFQPGTVYTVKITLEPTGAGVFSAKSTYNNIEGKTATLTSALTGDNYADSVILTYTFDKTAGGYHPGTGTGTGVTTYAITVKSAKNGDVTASHKTASKGTAVTLTVDPDKGYVLDTLTVLDGKDKELKLTEKNGKYTFTMPDSKVTVAATFKASAPTGKNPFIDVPAGSYYEDAVIWAVDKGITSGTSAVTFDPNGNCTRAQAVTFLWRAAGSPTPKTKVMPFADVKAGSYYYDAVLWAMEQGITKGTSDTAFSPNASCTRAQIVTFLWRANGSPAVSGNSAFTDVASDAYYAAAVTWAEKNGVTGGIGGGLFGSGNNCTRAQIVTFLYRAMK